MTLLPDSRSVKRVLVCGDRDWSDRELIFSTLQELWAEEPFLVIAGGCRGADTIAEEWAQVSGCECRVFKADWSLGRRAGPIRNARMLEQEPDLVVAFHDDLERSRGTRNMVKKAQAAGVPVLVVRHADTGTRTTITQSTIPLEGDDCGG